MINRFLIYTFGSTAVDVEITDDVIVLKPNKTLLKLSPCLYISADHKKKQLLSIGQEAAPTDSSGKSNKSCLIGRSYEEICIP